MSKADLKITIEATVKGVDIDDARRIKSSYKPQDLADLAFHAGEPKATVEIIETPKAPVLVKAKVGAGK